MPIRRWLCVTCDGDNERHPLHDEAARRDLRDEIERQTGEIVIVLPPGCRMDYVEPVMALPGDDAPDGPDDQDDEEEEEDRPARAR